MSAAPVFRVRHRIDEQVMEAALLTAFPPRWEPKGRAPLLPHQIAPPGTDWDTWILMGGRGSGKTEAGARYFCQYMQEHPGHRGRIIGPTLGDVFESCIDGPSGIKSVDPSVTVRAGLPGGSKVTWPNGSEALLIGTYSRPDVERLRASGNRHLDWWEEAGANRQFKDAYAQADFGLRLGDHPHRIVTTTPRNTTKLRELIQEQDGSVVVTKGTIRDNPHLPAKKKAALIKLYAGTRIGRQELDGELLTDVPGALWTWAMIESAHASLPVPAPDYVRVVVAVDPATTSGEEADDTGIIVVAQGTDGRGYVLADRTCHLSPSGWAHRVVEVFDEFEADEVVAETNNGGDLVESLIRTVRRSIPYRKVHASRGKAIRAEPVAALYEQTRVSHCEVFGNLEAEITGWQPEDGDSPNRLDALVWGISSLGMFKQSKRWRMI